jgi:hypothetical protein
MMAITKRENQSIKLIDRSQAPHVPPTRSNSRALIKSRVPTSHARVHVTSLFPQSLVSQYLHDESGLVYVR